MDILTANHDHVVGPTQSDGRDWRQAMRDAIRDPVELLRKLELDSDAQFVDRARSARDEFGLFVPVEFLRRMRPGNRNDPLLIQVLPLTLEKQQSSQYVLDPVADEAAKVRPGLLQKYPGRALLVVTGQCAVHCRYCFRREFDYKQHT